MIFLFTVSKDFPELADQNVILHSKQLQDCYLSCHVNWIK